MKKIIVYTDFSKNGMDAVKYAFEMSQDLKLGLRIVHFFKAQKSAGMLMSIDDRLKSDAVGDMLKTIESLKSSYPKGDFSGLEMNVSRGELMKSLAKSLKLHKSDFVVVGSKGEYDSSDVFLGSIAGSIIWQSDIPTLIIPKSYKYKSIKKVLLAIRNPTVASKTTLKPLLSINSLISDLGLKILLINKNKEPLGKFLSALDASLIHKNKENLYKQSQSYSDEKDIDLLTVVRRQRGFFSNFILNTKMSSKTWSVDKPTLVLHGVKEK